MTALLPDEIRSRYHRQSRQLLTRLTYLGTLNVRMSNLYQHARGPMVIQHQTIRSIFANLPCNVRGFLWAITCRVVPGHHTEQKH